MNKVFLTGHLGMEPKLSLVGEVPKITLRMAVHRNKITKDNYYIPDKYSEIIYWNSTIEN